MIEVFGDIWNYADRNDIDYICITTNGRVKMDGALIMGAGIAGQAKKIFPGIEFLFGDEVRTKGNRVHIFNDVLSRSSRRKKNFYNLISFPTKHLNVYSSSDLKLIERSTYELDCIARDQRGHTFLLPRPGCSNGGLEWEDVKPVVSSLPHNVLVINWAP